MEVARLDFSLCAASDLQTSGRGGGGDYFTFACPVVRAVSQAARFWLACGEYSVRLDAPTQTHQKHTVPTLNYRAYARLQHSLTQSR
ncbi:unnamed protein product [Peniophora sp. CBMAI 1063]|nr:unnamed protein product [Peniophora sp. CBMAI 1063]